MTTESSKNGARTRLVCISLDTQEM